MLFETATGEFPFGADDDETEEEQYEQLKRRAEPIRAHRRVPGTFARLVGECLEPDPTLRPAVDDLARRLANLVS